MPILNWIKSKFLNQTEGPYALSDPQLGRSILGVTSWAGKPVTKETALRCASFFSGVKMLANDIAKMPLVAYQRKTVDGRQRTTKALDLDIFPLLKDVPNPWMTSFQMRWMQIFHLFFEGHFYVQKLENQAGTITGLIPLNPWNVTKRWDRKANPPALYFDYDDGTTKQTFTQEQIWWNSILNCYGADGQAIIALAKEALSVMMASDEVSGRYLANGMFASGFVTTDKDAEVDAVEGQNLIDNLTKYYAGSGNAGKFTFIPYGAKFEKMVFTAEESQLLESRKWNAEEVVRLLGGAPLLVKLGYGEKNSTYAASSAFLEEYFNTALMGLTVNIEQSILRDLIPQNKRSRYFVRHNADVSLRGSPRERAETNKILIDSGQRMPNECRESDDEDPIPGWDILFFPANTGIYDPETGEKYLPSQKQVEQLPSDQQGGNAIANASAERVLRREEKAGKVEARYASEVMAISMEKAEIYAKKRPEISRNEAKILLLTLFKEEWA